MATAREQKKRDAPPPSRATVEESGAGLIPELLRRGLTLGFSSFFLTEEAVRKAFGDTVPRDWLDFVGEQSERTRSEFLERLSAEIARSLESLDLVGLFDALMSGRTIDIEAQIRLGERTPSTGPRRRSVRIQAADRGKRAK